MKFSYFLLTSIVSTLLLCGCSRERDNFSRATENFDFGWNFHRGDSTGLESIVTDISNWRKIDLPHDWSIEDIPGTISPFDSTAIGGKSTGFTLGGTGWYAKDFVSDHRYTDKNVQLLFEGVYMNADIWINGQHAGNHPYGYTSFYFDITGFLKEEGENNRIIVRVRNEGGNSRWYSGSGIYRHVWMTFTGPVHVKQWGTFVKTRRVEESIAELEVDTKISNGTNLDKKISVTHIIKNSKGKEILSDVSEISIRAKSDTIVNRVVKITDPEVWSPESPTLYNLATRIDSEGKELDITDTKFGIRTLEFSPGKGFLLNGKVTELRGGCMHHDNGMLGACAYDRAEERRVELMKANGFNAIRTSHNPPSPAFLDACDRLGMLVIDEAFDDWIKGKKPEDYHLYFKDWWEKDIESMVLRDRNHPSVIMWSTGNETIRKMDKDVIEASSYLANAIRNLDSSRPVTAGVHRWDYENWDSLTSDYMAPLDVAGYNYHPDRYDIDFKNYPDRLVYCSESFPKDIFDYWTAVEDKPYVIGDFVWTGFDYLGEVSIGWHGFKKGYPWTVAYCGDLDICGFKRPQSYYREIVWGTGKKVAMFVNNPKPTFDIQASSPWDYPDIHPSWTWPGSEGKDMEVIVYSNCEKVILQLNGKEIGSQETNRTNRYTAKFRVPYQQGKLTALAFSNDKPVDQFELVTVSDPVRVKLSTDREQLTADGQDLAFVTVELVDKNGIRHPFAEKEINLEIEGEGKLIGFGTGKPNSVESFQQKQRTSFEGRAVAVIKSTKIAGSVSLKASTQGLAPGSITITSK